MISQTTLRWTARIWAAALFLFWGAFFVEHIVEWFAKPGKLPPVWVILIVACHGLFLIGLVLGWFHETSGAIVSILAAIVFFCTVAGVMAPIYLLFSIVPGIIWINLSAPNWRRAHLSAQGG